MEEVRELIVLSTYCEADNVVLPMGEIRVVSWGAILIMFGNSDHRTAVNAASGCARKKSGVA
jgi:hypothetical protein